MWKSALIQCGQDPYARLDPSSFGNYTVVPLADDCYVVPTRFLTDDSGAVASSPDQNSNLLIIPAESSGTTLDTEIPVFVELEMYRRVEGSAASYSHLLLLHCPADVWSDIRRQPFTSAFVEKWTAMKISLAEGVSDTITKVYQINSCSSAQNLEGRLPNSRLLASATSMSNTNLELSASSVNLDKDLPPFSARSEREMSVGSGGGNGGGLFGSGRQRVYCWGSGADVTREALTRRQGHVLALVCWNEAVPTQYQLGSHIAFWTASLRPSTVASGSSSKWVMDGQPQLLSKGSPISRLMPRLSLRPFMSMFPKSSGNEKPVKVQHEPSLPSADSNAYKTPITADDDDDKLVFDLTDDDDAFVDNCENNEVVGESGSMQPLPKERPRSELLSGRSSTLPSSIGSPQMNSKVPVQRPGVLNRHSSTGSGASSIEVPEDSPLFRATLIDNEKRAQQMKQQLKKTLRAAENLAIQYQASLDAHRAFVDAVKECQVLNDMQQYVGPAGDILHNAQEHFLNQFQSLLITPLQILYQNDIKSVEMRKKEFDVHSEQYYHSESKYLALKSETTADEKRQAKSREQDAKFNRKKVSFDLRRYNYWTYLQELHTRKATEIRNYFMVACEKEYRMYEDTANKLKNIRSNLEMVDRVVKSDGSKISIELREREEMRKQLQDSIQRAEESEKLAKEEMSGMRRPRANTTTISLSAPATPVLKPMTEMESTQPSAQSALTPVSNTLSPAVNNNLAPSSLNASSASKFRGIRDLDPSSNNADATLPVVAKKEGFLYTVRSNDAMQPISANAAAQSSVMQHSQWVRVWCVLANGYLHEYMDWDKRLEATLVIDLRVCSAREVQQSQNRRFCFEILSPYGSKMFQAMSEEDCKTWVRAISNGIELALNESTKRDQTASNVNKGEDPELLSNINRILQVDGNQSCVDCGAENPVWCSLNLGIVMCKECSGVHRSLGSHITKVRSLYLDKNCYTADILGLFECLGNHCVNKILESKPVEGIRKPTVSDGRDYKQQFINAKYIDRQMIVDEDFLPDIQFTGKIECTALSEQKIIGWLQSGDVPNLLQLQMVLFKRLSSKVPWNEMLPLMREWFLSLVANVDQMHPLAVRFFQLNGVFLE